MKNKYNKNNNKNEKKKNLLCRIVFGLPPKLYCEGSLYCNIEIVLQEQERRL